MVLNNNRYTKHYYIEGQRICSKLGKGFSAPPVGITQSVTPISGTYTNIANKVLVMLHRGDRKAGFDTLNTTYPASITIVPNSTAAETDRYFYHSDHLGSSSFISNNAGTTTQHLQYLPFGESFVEQKISTAYLTPYRFSGKEKDEETGYSYFGARYYNPELSIWLSVDPLASKYPHQSPYSYVGNRPIMVTDPNGMEEDNPIKDFFKGIGNVLSGRPWGSEHNLSLVKGNKPHKEWAFMRQPGQGIVKESYLTQLQGKADRYKAGEEDLAWADRLIERMKQSITHELEVKTPSDVTQPSTATETLHVPELPKVYQAEYRPTLLAGGMQTNVFLNANPVYSETGFKTTNEMGRPLFKVNNSDNITINLTRIQPTFGNTYGTSGVAIPGQFREYRVIPSFTYRVRLQIKN